MTEFLRFGVRNGVSKSESKSTIRPGGQILSRGDKLKYSGSVVRENWGILSSRDHSI